MYYGCTAWKSRARILPRKGGCAFRLSAPARWATLRRSSRARDSVRVTSGASVRLLGYLAALHRCDFVRRASNSENVSPEKPRGVGDARKDRRSEIRLCLEFLRLFEPEIGERVRAEFPAFID